ncbi:hypothetical protein [Helicobacter cinaedi]|uniref:hypothetical protein n=1 Tax=Helicobacter cinaedi TaxID=213 RepID=UPI000E0E7EF2|nr:hypothetical protein [Helicobacter cinaedi]
MPPLRIIQLIPPLHTSLTHYAQAQPKAHKPRYKRYFKHTSNPRAKPKNAESHFCICNFFSQNQNFKNLCQKNFIFDFVKKIANAKMRFCVFGLCSRV